MNQKTQNNCGSAYERACARGPEVDAHIHGEHERQNDQSQRLAGLALTSLLRSPRVIVRSNPVSFEQ